MNFSMLSSERANQITYLRVGERGYHFVPELFSANTYPGMGGRGRPFRLLKVVFRTVQCKLRDNDSTVFI